MKEKWRCLDAWLERFWQQPRVLTERIVRLLALGVLAGSIGGGMGIGMKDVRYVLWSLLLAAFCALSAYRLLRVTMEGTYEMLEGMVLCVKPLCGSFRLCRVQLRCPDGGESTMLLDKECRLREGRSYRFYFKTSPETLVGIKRLDAVLNYDTFYGCEETGKSFSGEQKNGKKP